MTDKEYVISETIRLIKMNHKVEDNIEQLLSEVYDLGYHIGSLQIKCTKHREHPDIQAFDLERDVEEIALYTDPIRINNVRNLHYNAKEITSNYVLVSDMSYNHALKDMADEYGDYKYFSANTGDRERHLTRLEGCYDDEEREYEYGQYNELEVRILFCKLYQVATSIACEEVYEMPTPVKGFFSYQKSMEEMENDGMDVENMKRRIVSYKKEIETNYPDYETWREFYFD